ncbi:MAG: bacillithiol biosynthesis cysteine-adding enzyme BshC [Lewinellaceae bacterium]|nr:bacillithiol biosynthesis cysteine-adding enzyme BshC [Lewinellaceae bacterium]
MHKTLIPYPAIPQLAKTDIAYATLDPALRPFFHLEPTVENFTQAIAERARVTTDRSALAGALEQQYQHLPDAGLVREHIAALRRADTFTVTTAHQPSLLLGPLYFVYKAMTTINLAAAVQQATGKHIVPVFVLGSEDHDLEELNHIRLFNKEIRWEPGVAGPVGMIPAATLAPVLEELKTILGDTEHAQALWSKIEQSYTQSDTFAEATQFIPVMQDELTRQTAQHLVATTIERLSALGFKSQAVPREINLFYLQPGSRERIVLENGQYTVLNTTRSFTPEALLAELEAHPERFSPNVVLRPLYQELVLPNLAYIGGGGELAYWLERRSLFEHYGIPYPILVRRNSVLWFDKDSIKRSLKFGFVPARYFDDMDTLVRAYIESQADAEVYLNTEIADLHQIYNRLAQKAQAIDPTLEKAVRADEVKTVAHLQQWESRLVRAEKQKHEVSLNQLRGLREKLFPGNSLQERSDNFIPYYLKYGERFFDALKANLDPFDAGFVLLEDC